MAGAAPRAPCADPATSSHPPAVPPGAEHRHHLHHHHRHRPCSPATSHLLTPPCKARRRSTALNFENAAPDLCTARHTHTRAAAHLLGAGRQITAERLFPAPTPDGDLPQQRVRGHTPISPGCVGTVCVSSLPLGPVPSVCLCTAVGGGD